MKSPLIDLKSLRTKKPAELTKYIVELEKAQTELNQAIYTNKEKKTHQVSVLKKAIARAKTVQTERAGEEK